MFLTTTIVILFYLGRVVQMAEEIISSTMTKPEASDSNSSNSLSQAQKPTTSSKAQRQNGPSSSKYKGVVPQQNGHWGAQIYAHHQRIWIGTFKTETAAASAYDIAALKLRPRNSGDPHRNFPENGLIEHERDFQASYTKEQVLNMIKDDSYQAKFREYLASRSIYQEGTNQTNPNDENSSKKEGYSCQELFRKELTPSDVGKLNRLVIPKRYAEKYFPTNDANFEVEGGEREREGEGEREREGEREGEGEGEGEGENRELDFYDKSMLKWSFRYCYWKSSKSFVFTRGWNKFVKDKDLKEKDIVAFYLCELRKNNASDGGEEVKKYYMIDIVPHKDSKSPNIVACNTSETPNTKEHKGLRLFGVQIS